MRLTEEFLKADFTLESIPISFFSFWTFFWIQNRKLRKLLDTDFVLIWDSTKSRSFNKADTIKIPKEHLRNIGHKYLRQNSLSKVYAAGAHNRNNSEIVRVGQRLYLFADINRLIADTKSPKLGLIFKQRSNRTTIMVSKSKNISIINIICWCL